MKKIADELDGWGQVTAEELLDEENIPGDDLHRKATLLTRRRILFSAMQCMAAKGYQKTTIREIAKLAGVTYGALYYHFKDKKALLLEANRIRVRKLMGVISLAFDREEDLFASLEWVFRQAFASVVNDPILFGVVRELNGMALTDPDFNRMHNEIDMELRRHILSGLGKRLPDMTAEKRLSLARMINVMLEGLLMLTLAKSPGIGPPEEVVEALFEALRLLSRQWNHEATAP